MELTYLIVFEQSENGWGAIAPDAAGTYGLGETVDEARQSLREGIGYLVQDAVERGLPVPEPKSTTVDFAEFEPVPSQSRFIVEWLTVEVPEPAAHPTGAAHQAA